MEVRHGYGRMSVEVRHSYGRMLVEVRHSYGRMLVEVRHSCGRIRRKTPMVTESRWKLNKELAQMLKGGVIMDVTTP